MTVSSRPRMARPNLARQARRLRLLATVAGTVAALAIGSPALADIKGGVDAWAKGDYATAVHEWEGPAGRGDPDAAFDLGQAYKLGRGVPQDLAKAEMLFGQAAAKGHLQAADNYGLLLFQRGDHARAMPYVAGAANRGDPRAEYLLGIAYFNGDIVAKDWVHAYAFENLAQDSGLQQAKAALAQMDKFIPLDQRQQAVALKSELAQQIEANRTRHLTALELGNTSQPSGASTGYAAAAPMPQPAPEPAAAQAPPAYSPPNPANPYSGFPAQAPQAAPQPVGDNAAPAPYQAPSYQAPSYQAPSYPPPAYASAAPGASPNASSIAGAQPRPMGLPPRPADLPRHHPHPAALADSQPNAAPAYAAPAPAEAPTSAPVRAAAPVRSASGPWKVQLGAFGVASNADALWGRVKGRPEIAGHPRAMVPTGKVNRLLATGYSEAAARAACARLTAAGLVCLVTKD